MMPVHTGLNGSVADPSVEQALKALEVVLSPVASSSERAQANQVFPLHNDGVLKRC
jgi:hypothetical protein